ncbi:BamA/TamA family outer membrane protein, partial [candidate division GN15 bacterium]|nr:BamA/TamA family outer membrane protein [candidate division GN15 bacterium]
MRSWLCLLILALVVAAAASATGQTTDRHMLRWIRNKPVIDSISIEGNEHFSDGTIESHMYSRTRNFWRALRGDRRSRLQRETAEKDSLEIMYLYLSNGFLGVLLEQDYRPLEPDSNVLVHIIIHEGARFRYGQTEITGHYPAHLSDDLERVRRRLNPGRPVNPFQIREAMFDMKTILANHGYPYAEISYQLDTLTAPPTTDVEFEVRSDDLVHFGNVTITGLKNYEDKVARRELRIRPDEVYRRRDILASQERLWESGYFSTFQITRQPDSDDRLRPDFRLSVRERKPHYANFKIGAGQSEVQDLQWDISTSFGKRNFFGSRRLELLADYSFSVGTDARLITHRYRVRYTEPWLMHFRMPLTLTGEFEPPIQSVLQDYTIQSWAISLSTVRRLGRQWEFNGGLQYESVEISDVPPELIPVTKERDTISVRRKLYFGIRYDSRDQLFVPSDGNHAWLNAEYNGGFLAGDESFYKAEAQWATYNVVWPGWISASRIRAGVARPFGESQAVPSDERLYLGGANTIRGFRENVLGPATDAGEARGADYTLFVNQEFRWKTIQVFNKIPLIGPLLASFPLWQSVFVDVGNG